MPPQSSSHTPGDDRQVIRISPLALMACFLLLFCISFPVLGWPEVFGWMLAIPFLIGAWVLRVRTTVTPEGLELRRPFSSVSISWDQIKGFRFPKRGWARADLVDGSQVALPVVTFGRLPQLASASGGRVTDPYAAARAAASDKNREEHEEPAAQSATTNTESDTD
ncbi:PH domain-containing protein [Rhodococcus spongiicola]|uniref:PH domain-containing protein n=1 Tax=Rhodococcus spongiicola TaxID=2487352 RepID=A0A3S3E3T5_9NOCA|nr:PH domain-containing protein [Rhodococcus spongiicola]RVW04714.1 PH domain-containing protein [Rhodococcus spongiicola]